MLVVERQKVLNNLLYAVTEIIVSFEKSNFPDTGRGAFSGCTKVRALKTKRSFHKHDVQLPDHFGGL